MSFQNAARTAKYLGYFSYGFEKVLTLLKTIGSKTYDVIADRPKYQVEIKVADQHIELRDSVTTGEVKQLLDAMKHFDHVTLVIRRGHNG